jgi:hypothetical protein
MAFNEKAAALIFEVTHGCQYSCTGCTVNKQSSKLPDRDGFNTLVTFLDDLEENDITLAELELGPTDILSSINRDEVLSDPIFNSMAKRFQLLTFIVGLILPHEEEYVRLSDQINLITDKIDIGIVTPIELTHVNNEKYLRTIEKNVNTLIKHLKAPLVEVILQVQFDARFLTQQLVGSPSYDKLFDRIHSLDLPVRTKVNFTLPHGRSKLETELVAGNFLDSIKALNTFYIRDMKRRGDKLERRHIPFQLLNPRHSGEVLWHDENLYIRPIINERFTVLSKDRKFAQPWTYDNFVAISLEMTNRSLEKGLQIDDCVSCEHLMTCANRGIHEVMDVTNASKCIMLLKDYGHLSIPLQNGNYSKIDWSSLNVSKY